ncbi:MULTISPECIES: NrdJb [unclassified Colwellia]|uniref:TSCPD domain-containing protein n=1 Tax=unclassified Colwellia TaxID=196834 RepID=UPI0015F4AC3D|nr:MULTISPECIES: NrdJb [unclassified Colwellia]MBA6363882.1 NrdJb [Colwellia sp. BRX8-8]MBA6348215.1 NrdJb [Colwellia sp. BRX8-9]MBA6351399.1 NrdJb [Colwellia sp. BRX9-1]MBA6354631.1 NrdJb [Colwellia sp. BRX8-3]MBA6358956.1 NrdJb [Colwellia sp. BRX8-6]|tara:strand:- start:274 stop:942 length:669 start_codon:yes stop_codon:yes gene_type:complete
MREINQAITAVKVLVADQLPVKEKIKGIADKLTESTKRPEMLIGSTYKIKPPVSDHALYITINDILLNQESDQETRRPFEIFVNSKNMEFYSWVVALTRVISAVFRKGGDCTFLVEELKAVFDPKGGYYQRGTGIFMPSVVADIGHVIETHLKALDMLPKSERDNHQQAYIEEKRQTIKAKEGSELLAFPTTASQCVKCYQKSVISLDNCATCLNCGDSKCG